MRRSGRFHDWCNALNPLAVEGQIIGSCHMGMGQVLSEEMKYGRTGHLLNPILGLQDIHGSRDARGHPIIVESNILKVRLELKKLERGLISYTSSGC